MDAAKAGMQVLAGDVKAAHDTFDAFFGVWRRYGLLPERYLYGGDGMLHPTERYYPLRPELIESAFYLYQVREVIQQVTSGVLIGPSAKYGSSDGCISALPGCAGISSDHEGQGMPEALMIDWTSTQ